MRIDNGPLHGYFLFVSLYKSNNPESPLWQKLLLLRHSALGVPMSRILKSRVAAISGLNQIQKLKLDTPSLAKFL
jgi:hypothetical protein